MHKIAISVISNSAGYALKASVTEIPNDDFPAESSYIVHDPKSNKITLEGSLDTDPSTIQSNISRDITRLCNYVRRMNWNGVSIVFDDLLAAVNTKDGLSDFLKNGYVTDQLASVC